MHSNSRGRNHRQVWRPQKRSSRHKTPRDTANEASSDAKNWQAQAKRCLPAAGALSILPSSSGSPRCQTPSRHGAHAPWKGTWGPLGTAAKRGGQQSASSRRFLDSRPGPSGITGRRGPPAGILAQAKFLRACQRTTAIASRVKQMRHKTEAYSKEVKSKQQQKEPSALARNRATRIEQAGGHSS